MLSKTDLKLDTEYSFKTAAEPNRVRYLFKNPEIFLSLNTDIEVFNSAGDKNVVDINPSEYLPVPGPNEPATRELDKKPSLVLVGATAEG